VWRLLGRQHHDHLPAFHARHRLDLGERVHLAADAVQNLQAELGMDHLAAAEAQGDLHLVAFLDEPLHGAHLHFVIVVVDVGAHLDLFDLDDLLVLTRLVRLLLRFVFVFAVVGDLGDRRNRIGRDLDQIETGLFGHLDGLAGTEDADHVAVLVDQSDLRRFDFAVDARTLAGGRALLSRSGYGFILLR
jgi:hypothetical protein